MAFSTELFGYSDHLKLFTVDISQLQCASPNRQVFERIYPDSADQGIRLISHKTGIETAWFVSHVDTQPDSDGSADIVGWNLQPTIETKTLVPALRNARLLIVNT